jgi:cysteinyl-tRNA synthetase
MAISFYNTLTRKEESFQPLDLSGNKVSLYCCGPTVYNFAHIGNFRTFVFEDLLRRFLEARGYDVLHVMNVTDVEDKIIRSIHQSGEDLHSFTRKYETAFLEDLEHLGCLLPKIMPRATEHIQDIISLIQTLQEKGIAYRADDGSVYFSIEKFPSYGRLARLDLSQLKPGARVSQDEHAKEAYGDFALWKAYSEKDGQVAWDSPWGRGRPGWHIECSCMSMKHLGQTIDIHCGGEDLVFPHHEDEIAQSEGATNKPFVRFWLHSAHLLVNGQKMSKSAGNFFTLRDLLAKGYTGREIRYALLSAHYRLPLNFTLEGLEASRQALRRIEAWAERLLTKVSGHNLSPPREGPLVNNFLSSLESDLNISEALGGLFETIRESNRLMDENTLSQGEAEILLGNWQRIEAEIIGLGYKFGDLVSDEIEQLAKERDAARKARDWKKSDELRDTLKLKGWLVKDTPKGYKLIKAS